MAPLDRQNLILTPEENAALHLLSRHHLEPPFDLDGLVARYADVEEQPFPMRGDALLVEFPKDHRRPLIVLNSNRTYVARRRFTLAHELGHIFIAWHFGNFNCSPSLSEEYMGGEYHGTEAEASRFASELLLPSPWLVEYVARFALLSDLIGNVMSMAGVSVDTARIKLMRCLPPGYICTVENHTTGKMRVEASDRTPKNLVFDFSDRDDPRTLFAKIDKVAVDRHEERRLTRTTRIWKIKCDAEIPEVTDPRLSTEILDGILKELFGNSPLALMLSRSINGKVGAANCLAISRKADEIYGVLKLRFDKSDMTGDENLSKVRGHRWFNNFVINKANEIASGRSGKQRQRKPYGHKLPPNSLFE